MGNATVFGGHRGCLASAVTRCRCSPILGPLFDACLLAVAGLFASRLTPASRSLLTAGIKALGDEFPQITEVVPSPYTQNTPSGIVFSSRSRAWRRSLDTLENVTRTTAWCENT